MLDVRRSVDARPVKLKKDQKVVLAFPHGHEVSARFLKWVMTLLAYDAATKGRIMRGGDFIGVSSGANITNARNEIVVAFLDKTDADWLLFVDTDMVPPGPELVDQLVEAAHPEKRPILGALCFSLNHNGQMLVARPTIYGLSDDSKVVRYDDYPRDEVVQVGATGTGCLLIHRTVLEAMRARQFHAAYPWFMESAFGAVPCGEDITFCVRAGSLGFPVHVDTRIKVGHEKPWVVDEPMFLAQKAWRAAQPKPPTFVVIPGRDRHDMTYSLLAQVMAQADRTFLYDNGSCPPYRPFETDMDGAYCVVDAAGRPLHRMWNDGLDMAEKAAAEIGAVEWNVAILNNDLEVPSGFLAELAAGLRSRDDHMAAYPNVHGLDLPTGHVARTTLTGSGMTGRSIAGYAFMVRGEAGLRFDEQFEWWYGDDDLEQQIAARGGHVVCCSTTVNHLEPNKSTEESPERQAMAARDRDRFTKKWAESIKQLAER